MYSGYTEKCDIWIQHYECSGHRHSPDNSKQQQCLHLWVAAVLTHGVEGSLLKNKLYHARASCKYGSGSQKKKKKTTQINDKIQFLFRTKEIKRLK